MSRARQELGARGEDLAADFFIKRGFSVVAKNWRCRAGEIDLVVLKNGDLRVIEVKTRKSLGAGYPEEAVTNRKLDHMEAVVLDFLEHHPGLPEDAHFDVLAIVISPTGVPSFRYIPDIE